MLTAEQFEERRSQQRERQQGNKDYDSTLARIAGNIAAGMSNSTDADMSEDDFDIWAYNLAVRATNIAVEIANQCRLYAKSQAAIVKLQDKADKAASQE